MAELVRQNVQQLERARLRLGPADLDSASAITASDTEEIEQRLVVTLKARVAALPPKIVLPSTQGDYVRSHQPMPGS